MIALSIMTAETTLIAAILWCELWIACLTPSDAPVRPRLEPMVEQAMRRRVGMR